MRKFAVAMLGLICLLPGVARAEAAGTALPLEINGELEINNRLSLAGDKDYLNYNNLDIFALKAKSVFAGKATAFGELRIKHTGFAQFRDLELIADRTMVEPTQLELKEAYIESKNFIVNGLDLKLGKQRIVWGSADGVNPTDNLNPKNLEDPIDFKQKIGVNALILTAYTGPVTVTGVYIPVFVPAVFPVSLMPLANITEGLALTPLAGRPLDLQYAIRLPSANPSNSMAAGKVAWKLMDYDMSASFYYGRDDLPSLQQVVITPTLAGRVNVQTQFVYPQMRVIGYDFSGSILEMGVWGEAACFIPEKIATTTVLLGQALSDTTVLEQPYFKYVLGADYSWSNDWYMNIQLLHGFFTEHCHDLRNYLTAQLEKSLLAGVLKITLKGGVDISDLAHNQSGYMPNLEITYKPVDNIEMLLGGIMLEGQEHTTLGLFKDLDQAYAKIKYSF